MADAPFYDPPEHSSNAAAAANDTQMEGPVCWKCEGTGILRHRKRKANVRAWDNRHPGPPPPCTICKGCGRLQPKKKQRVHSNDPGVVTTRKFVPSAWASNGVPGPAPARIGAPERGEELCFLTGDWRIFQKVGGHRYSTEDVVTAWVAGGVGGGVAGEAATAAARPLRALDLGTGIGSVMMMVAWRLPAARVVGVEAQSLSASMARRSLRYNGADVGGRCSARHADMREEAQWLAEEERGAFDLVTGTPPYFPVAHIAVTKSQSSGGGGAAAAAAAPDAPSAAAPAAAGGGDATTGGGGSNASMVAIAAMGALPTCRQSAPARYEFRGGIEAYCAAASRALRRPTAPAGVGDGCARSGGRFVVCEGYLAGNAARVADAAQTSGLRVLEQLSVMGREGKRPLFAVYTMCHADDPSDLRGWPSPAADPAGSGGGASAAARATTIKSIVVRTHDGPRTPEYCALMQDMGMPHGGEK